MNKKLNTDSKVESEEIIEESLKENIFLIVKIIFIVILFIIFIKFLNIDFSVFDIDWYSENHYTSKPGEVTLYHFTDENYCFNDYEKKIIQKVFEQANVNIKDITECGEVKINFDTLKYRAFGYIYLSSDDSFIDLRKMLEERSELDNKVDLYDKSIYIDGEFGNIHIEKNDIDDTFRLIYAKKIPYVYKLNETDDYPPIVKFFLDINNRNNYD